jgi:hypothetical protein
LPRLVKAGESSQKAPPPTATASALAPGLLDQARHCRHQHQHATNEDRCGTVAFADLEHRRRHLDLFVQTLPRRTDEHDQEGDDHAHAEGIDPCAFGW